MLDINPVEACIKAIKAGVNILLYRASDDKTVEIVEKLYLAAQDDEALCQNTKIHIKKYWNLKIPFDSKGNIVYNLGMNKISNDYAKSFNSIGAGF